MAGDPQPSEALRPAPQFVFYLVPLVIVLAVGALFLVGGGNFSGRANEKEEPKPPAKVEVDKDYYVIVTLMEFHPQKISGKKWDVPDSAPDIFYELQWHGKTIFSTENDVAKNALIAHWIGLGADITIRFHPVSSRSAPGSCLQGCLVQRSSAGASPDARFHAKYWSSTEEKNSLIVEHN